METIVTIVTIETISNGAMAERFGVELQKVLANIADPNTKAETTREITMKVKIKPDRDRKLVAIALETTSKVAPYLAVESTGWITKVEGKAALVESNPHQFMLDVPTAEKNDDKGVRR